MKKNICRALLVTASLSVLPLQAAPMPLADNGSPSTRDYLADRSRVGSLAGTVIGGALTAHPVGTVVGAVVGYIVGKDSDFTASEAEGLAATTLEQGGGKPRVNPLASCFGEHSPQLVDANRESHPVVSPVSLVTLQPIDNVKSARTGQTLVSPSGSVARRNRLSPCFYYSSW
jgi:hypothetical protein